MNNLVERTCTKLHLDAEDGATAESEPLSAYRSAQAYVLLGDPGSGKTTAFQTECQELGDQARFISAHNFLLHEAAPDELCGKTLFIDGLDEVRAGTSDVRTPLEQIRRLLLKLDRPRFRISCREADWLGETDLSKLEYVAKDSAVVALRLDALSAVDIGNILRERLGVRDPNGFMEEASEKGVDGLLVNPQGLELLATAVKQGTDWPKSRLEVFELACNQLATERNREHLDANRTTVPLDSLIESAGRLCALQLIADRFGFSLDRGSTDVAYPFLDRFCQGGLEELRAAVSTKLFRAVAERRFSPVHRQIAEFLGASYLAGLIRKGLPARRVLALMRGGDGVVVTALRGLSAWLATYSEPVRNELLSDDPLGMGVYGDVHLFSAPEKRRLLGELLRRPRNLARASANAESFAPLAVPEAEPQILQVLVGEDRSAAQEARAEFVLRLLSRDRRLPNLAQEMLRIVRDSSWSPHLREGALDAFIRNRQDSPELDKDLEELLRDIKAAGNSVSNRDILGTLLGALYPRVVRPGHVWDYFTESGGASAAGSYWQFWQKKLIAQSSDTDVADLLDSLASQGSNLQYAFDYHGLRGLPVSILKRGLRAHGDSVSTERVSQWLAVGSYALGRSPGNPTKAALWIRKWLEGRPEIQKDIVLMGLKKSREHEHTSFVDFKNRKRLLGARLPEDFGLWCLRQAAYMAETRPKVARHLFLEAYTAYNSADLDEGLSQSVLQEHARRNESLEELLADLQSPPPPPRDAEKRTQRQASFVETQERRRRDWLASVRSSQKALLENRAEPILLYQLALVYFGVHPDFEEGCRGKEALARVLGQSGTLDAAMYGLQGTISRDDLPSEREVVRLVSKRREHYLGLPLLAGLEERESSSPGYLQGVEGDRVRISVACYHAPTLAVYGARSDRPVWYQGLLDSRPDVVSEVGVRCAAAALRSGQPPRSRFWDLVEKEIENDVARGAILELLKAFPTRSKVQRLDALDRLLWVGIRRRAETALLDLARCKLSKAGMNAGQRVRWLGTGLITAPAQYRKATADAVEGHQKLVRHLGRFLSFGENPVASREDGRHYLFDDLDSSTLAVIVRLLGRFFDPYKPARSGSFVLSFEVRVSLFLRKIIEILGSRPDNHASESLHYLTKEKTISRWNGYLISAHDAQVAIRRDAEYCHPSLKQACEALRGGSPASAADLAALTFDALRNIAVQIRTSNRNEWRPFWNEHNHGRDRDPKIESACRDAIRSMLDRRLPETVTDEPEAQHVNQNRVDIEVSSQGFRVPIEVKRNSDRRLWNAVRDQLIAKYTLDPATNGYGIYLVLWFGVDKQHRRADGVRPKSPQELEELLQESLSEGERRKISICVIDVCPPNAQCKEDVAMTDPAG